MKSVSGFAQIPNGIWHPHANCNNNSLKLCEATSLHYGNGCGGKNLLTYKRKVSLFRARLNTPNMKTQSIALSLNLEDSASHQIFCRTYVNNNSKRDTCKFYTEQGARRKFIVLTIFPTSDACYVYKFTVSRRVVV